MEVDIFLNKDIMKIMCQLITLGFLEFLDEEVERLVGAVKDEVFKEAFEELVDLVLLKERLY
jgi:hypothetical protein